jgi:hypothetical protein
MKRFVWRLQHVLDIRTNEEQTKRTELLKITERLAESRGELLTRQAILRDMISRIGQKKPHKRLGEQEFFFKHSAASEEQVKILKARARALESEQRQKMAEQRKPGEAASRGEETVY